MRDPNSQVISMMRTYLSNNFLGDITQSVIQAYEEAHIESVANVHEKLIKRDRPQRRVHKLDTKLEKIAKRHFEVQGDVKDNSNGSNTFAELIVQEKLILTSSSVQCPRKLPRSSKTRLSHSLHNPTFKQLELHNSNLVQADFTNRSIIRTELSKLFVLLLHGPTNEARPEFIKLVVPDADYSFFIGTIDLLSEYAAFQSPSQEDLEPREIPRPSARLRVNQDDYVEDEDRLSGEGENLDETT